MTSAFAGRLLLHVRIYTVLSSIIVIWPDLWSVWYICPSLKFCTVLLNLGVGFFVCLFLVFFGGGGLVA